MARRTTRLAVALAAAALAGSPVGADVVPDIQITAEHIIVTNGYQALVGARDLNPSPPREIPGVDSGDRDAGSLCSFSANSLENGTEILTVRGTAAASGRPRVVTTEVRCRVVNRFNQIVFDLSRTETGSVANLAGTVIMLGNGPYTFCASAGAVYDDGEHVVWPGPYVHSMFCAAP